MGTNDEILEETINSDSNCNEVLKFKNTDMTEHMSRVKNVHKYRIQEDDSFWGRNRMHQIQKYVGIYEKHKSGSQKNLPKFICMSHYADYHYNNLHNEISNKDFFDTGVKWMQEYTKSPIVFIESRNVYILFYKIFGKAAFFDFLLKESILYTNNIYSGEVFYSASVRKYITVNPHLNWVLAIYSDEQLDSVGYAYINYSLRIIEIMKDKKELGLYQDYLFLNIFKIMNNHIRKAIFGKVSEPQNFDINSYIDTLFDDFRQEICALGIDCDSTFTRLLNPITYPLPMSCSTLEELGSIFIRTQLVPNISKLTRRKKPNPPDYYYQFVQYRGSTSH